MCIRDRLNTIKLKDDLYVIHNDFVPGNTTALITNDGVLLVDDKFEIDHAGILAELKKITDKPVKYIINTHHHGCLLYTSQYQRIDPNLAEPGQGGRSLSD